jgi:hypothetical protein
MGALGPLGELWWVAAGATLPHSSVFSSFFDALTPTTVTQVRSAYLPARCRRTQWASTASRCHLWLSLSRLVCALACTLLPALSLSRALSHSPTRYSLRIQLR